MGFQPAAIAMDTQTRRVFVVDHAASVDEHVPVPITVSILDTTTKMILSTRVLPTEGYTTVPGPQGIALDERTNRVFILTNSRHVDASTSRTSYSGNVSTLDTRTGAVLRTVHLANPATAVAVDARTTRVFVLTTAIIPDDGDLTGHSPSGSGAMTIMDAATGSVLGRVAVGAAPDALAVDERSGRVFVANLGPLDLDSGIPTRAGSVSALDARSGAVLRTVTVGVFPTRLAIDERSGRVFALNLGLRTGLRYTSTPRHSSVSVLDGTTGRSLATVGIGDASGSIRVAAEHGHVLIAVAGGLIMLDATSGTRLPGHVHVDGLNHVTVEDLLVIDDRRRPIVVIIADALPSSASRNDAGLAVVVDERDGATVVSHHLEIRPDAAVLDERSGQIFVANTFALCPAGPDSLPAGSVSVFNV